MKSLQGKLTEEEIDDIVIAQADDDEFWEDSLQVHQNTTSLSIPADLASRAAFLAQLHRTHSLNEWIVRIVQERVELEEAAFTEAKRTMAVEAA